MAKETKPTAKAPEAIPEQKFSKEALRKVSVKTFGISTSTFDAAMYGRDGEYGVEETRAIIENWKKGVIE